ncbi:fungal-specific transcription factor domain-containing protein, partial [Amylocarpus encephaloides]
TATIPSPHSLAAILSPATPSEEPITTASRALTPKRTHSDAFPPQQQTYLHPTSPTQFRPSLPAVSAPSPAPKGPDDGSGGNMRSWEEQKPAKTVRSSVNNGVNSTCKTCASANRECTYPAPGSMPNPRRNEFTPGVRPEEGETKKRNRKVDDSGRRNFHKITEDALDLPLLTKKVWHEIFEIFKLHFSTEMPFLHPPTFKNRMRQASNPRDPTVPATGPQEGKVLLLGVLTLTARFHPELVAYHSPSGDALAASGYYAEALKVAFGPTSGNLTNPSLDVIQACLMLSLYEWGQAQGRSGWVYVGIATRLAQSIGLPYEDDADPPKNGTQQNGLTRTMLAEKEIRRRTWWSCFIMDRMLSAGRYRPTMIDVEKLRVQLPCSDDQFLFVSKARTPSLNASWPREEDPEASSYDYSALGWYIRLVEIFGRFSEWSFAGGRRTEKLPPWERESHFSRIREELQTFQLSLPASLAYTTENLSAHIEKRNATVYASMHTLFALCQIMLHREHIPFIPLRSRRPSGPLDEPTFPPSKHSIPEGFWEESAATMFKAAKEITNIVQTCQEDNALPESAMIGFAIWQASFVCLYSCHFPHMDTAGSFHPDPDHLDNANAPNWLEVTSGLLNDLSPRLSMVKGHQKTLRKMHDYFKAVKKTYNDHIETGDKIFPGGDADGYSHHRKELREFGNLED